MLEEYLPEGTYQLEVTLEDASSSETLGQARREIIVPRGDGPLVLPPLELEPTDDQKTGRQAGTGDRCDRARHRPAGQAGRLPWQGGPARFLGLLVRRLQCEHAAPRGAEPQIRGPAAGDPRTSRPVGAVARAYDRKIATVRERIWGGRDLPFRVLLDRPDPNNHDGRNPGKGTGTTIKRYSVTGFPSLFVIDRDGTMIGPVGHSESRSTGIARPGPGGEGRKVH